MEKRTLFAEIYLDVKRAFAYRKFNKRYKQIKSYLDKQINDNDIIYPSRLGRWDLESQFPVLYLGKVEDMTLPNIANILYFKSEEEIKILSLLNEKTEDSKWDGKDFKAMILYNLQRNNTHPDTKER